MRIRWTKSKLSRSKPPAIGVHDWQDKQSKKGDRVKNSGSSARRGCVIDSFVLWGRKSLLFAFGWLGKICLGLFQGGRKRTAALLI